LRPLRWLRLPVDEWVVAIALAIRCLPLLIDEVRSLAAARRLRSHVESEAQAKHRGTTRGLLMEAHDLMATAIVTSIRRARDLADAIESRGGLGAGANLPPVRVGVVDVLVMLTGTALCVVSLAVLHL